MSDEPVDEWYGIVADSTGRVTAVRLRDNGLEGTLPAALGDLAELRSLQLHDNDLTGSIPRELGGLGRLGWLWLNDNDLTGSLPEELAGLDSLRGLWVGNNGLEGSRARGAARRMPKCCGLCTKPRMARTGPVPMAGSKAWT